LREVVLQQFAKFGELLQVPIEIGQFSGEQRLHLLTSVATPSILKPEELANLAERESMELRLLDKSDAFQRACRVEAEAP
jgi:hypothetical protein